MAICGGKPKYFMTILNAAIISEEQNLSSRGRCGNCSFVSKFRSNFRVVACLVKEEKKNFAQTCGLEEIISFIFIPSLSEPSLGVLTANPSLGLI
ncbi:hypothetical protein CEXT_544551 [Caerostris extrusa]|uniref:Uncharacterized protein n=1 Tax=Caerostris extrusa TaxID=172846 RepID=A0AAV4MXC9_CAEEX|nr:hypothetical protein CEXT_544551 [Caerostris extrusa]